MTFKDFCDALKEQGATKADVYRLEREGRISADDAHRDMFEHGDMPEIRTENDYHSFCAYIGRDFVLDNIGILFNLAEQEKGEQK